MAGQNMSGLSLTRPNTAGSEASGSKVAAIKAMKKTVLRPTSGKASTRIIQSSQTSIVCDYRQQGMRVEPRALRDFAPLYSCLVFQQPPSPPSHAHRPHQAGEPAV